MRETGKQKQKAPVPKKSTPRSNRREQKSRQLEKPTQPKNQNVKTAKKPFGNRDGDRFESLVEQYKKKLMACGDKSISMKRNKWFDT